MENTYFRINRSFYQNLKNYKKQITLNIKLLLFPLYDVILKLKIYDILLNYLKLIINLLFLKMI